MTTAGGYRKLLPFLPSLAFGAVGGVWIALSPRELPNDAGPGLVLGAGLALAAALLAIAWLLELTVPSFRHASRTVERAVARLRLPTAPAIALAALTALGEELFFRFGVMGVIGVWGQAALFGILHPVSIRGWAYSLFTGFAGLVLGYAVVFTGSLWTAVIAHLAVNLHGLLGSEAKR